MEKAITKEELLNFKNNLMLEYDYYLDLNDRIKKVERFETIDDYIKAIERYNEVKKKYKAMRIGFVPLVQSEWQVCSHCFHS